MLKKDLVIFLKKENFFPSKKMGQNFLINPKIKEKIVNAAKISDQDTILEIGPGFGAITKMIIPRCKKLFAIELDKRLFAYLNKNFSEKNFFLFNDDILKFDLNEMILDNNLENLKVIANLPYSISSKIIIQLLQVKQVSEIYILVQKEMAFRISASTNTKQYNALSALINYFCETKQLFIVNPGEFYPIPKVDSVFLKLTKLDVDFSKFSEYSSFFRVCFLNKRKKLSNNLLTIFNIEKIKESYLKLNLDSNIRPSELSGIQLVQLYNDLYA